MCRGGGKEGGVYLLEFVGDLVGLSLDLVLCGLDIVLEFVGVVLELLDLVCDEANSAAETSAA